MAEEKDLNKAEPTAAGIGQPENKPAQKKIETEAKPIESEDSKKLADLQARLAKVEQERDNYRTGLLSAKAKKTSLSQQEEEAEEPKPIQEVKPATPEEESWKEVERRARLQTEQVLEARTKKEVKQNEQVAIKKWMQTHPELLDDALRLSVVEEYIPKNGKSVDGIILDLERAYKLYNIDHNLESKPAIKETSPEQQLASVPTASAKPATTGGFNPRQLEVMQENNITPENFEKIKKAVEEGRLNLPDNVMQILFT